MYEKCRKTVMTGRHGSMRGKHALVPNRFYLGFREAIVHRLKSGALLQERKRDKCRVAFVHMENTYAAVTEGAEHRHTAKTQHDFLAQTIQLVTPVEMV